MSISKVVIYQGAAFTIEWYFDERGSSAAHAYYEKLSLERKVKLLKLVKLMGEIGKIFDKTKFNNEHDQIYAFKPQPDRFLCFFFTGRKIIISNAFEKKTAKLPPGEKDRALKAKADYEARIKKGTYYGKN